MPRPAFCEQCGAQLAASVRFCEACGVAVSVPAVEGAESIGSAESHDQARCPRCETSAGTYLVAGIHEEIEAETLPLDEGPAAGLSATELEELRERVAPPKPPSAPNLAFWLVAPFIPMINIVVIWFAPLGRAVKATLVMLGVLVAAGWAYRFHAEAVHGAPAEFLGDRYPSLGPLSALDAPLVLLPVFLAVYFIGVTTEIRRRCREIQTIEMPRWHDAMDRWRRQRYCSTCRHVFLPERLEGDCR